MRTKLKLLLTCLFLGGAFVGAEATETYTIKGNGLESSVSGARMSDIYEPVTFPTRKSRHTSKMPPAVSFVYNYTRLPEGTRYEFVKQDSNGRYTVVYTPNDAFVTNNNDLSKLRKTFTYKIRVTYPDGSQDWVDCRLEPALFQNGELPPPYIFEVAEGDEYIYAYFFPESTYQDNALYSFENSIKVFYNSNTYNLEESDFEWIDTGGSEGAKAWGLGRVPVSRLGNGAVALRDKDRVQVGYTIIQYVGGRPLSNNTGSSDIETVKVINKVCFKDANKNGTALSTKMGVSIIQSRLGNSTWPKNRMGAWTALESNKGGLVLTRMTTQQINAMQSPQLGMITFDTTENCIKLYDGTKWGCLVESCDN